MFYAKLNAEKTDAPEQRFVLGSAEDDALHKIIAESVARLRANDQAEDAESREAGRTCGAEWAGTATKRQLRRLAKHVGASDGRNAETGTPEDFVRVANNGMNGGHADSLLETLNGPNARWMESQTWEDIIGEDHGDLIDDENFAIGFIEGALLVWETKNAT
ncbi:MAG: hypothetical protein U0792_00700 [Gemmataceae bacterium]